MDKLNRATPIAGWVSKRCHVISKKAKDHKGLRILERSVLSFPFLHNIRTSICNAVSQKKNWSECYF